MFVPNGNLSMFFSLNQVSLINISLFHLLIYSSYVLSSPLKFISFSQSNSLPNNRLPSIHCSITLQEFLNLLRIIHICFTRIWNISIQIFVSIDWHLKWNKYVPSPVLYIALWRIFSLSEILALLILRTDVHLK